MIYPVDLKQAGLAAGAILLVAHLGALVAQQPARKLLADFPRSRIAGIVLMSLAALWSFLLIRTMDLGEFAGMRGVMLGGILAAGVLMIIYVPEFLAVRALGMLMLLAAEPLLGAAFLRPETSRLLLVVLAYAWVFAGLFWVGMPWLLRDQVKWLLAGGRRFPIAAWAGAAYGFALLALAVAAW
jgi:hypothetical protein